MHPYPNPEEGVVSKAQKTHGPPPLCKGKQREPKWSAKMSPEFNGGFRLQRRRLRQETQQLLRAGSGVKGAPAKRGVHRRPLTPRPARHPRCGTKPRAVDGASSSVGAWGWSRPRPVSLNPTVDLATTSHLPDLQSPTMIRFPNSPFSCKGRQGAQSICRWKEVHRGYPRATLHASRWQGAGGFAQPQAAGGDHAATPRDCASWYTLRQSRALARRTP
jgi:hypothetical protein